MTSNLLQGPATARNISLPKNLNDALERQAQQEDRPVSRIVRRALILYLEQQHEGINPERHSADVPESQS